MYNDEPTQIKTQKRETRMTDKATDTVQPGQQVATTEKGGAIAERRSFIPEGDTSGTEDIGANEIRLPRMAIAQGLSHQMIPGDSMYIDGLKMFELFNDLSGRIYGMGPISFIPLCRDVRRIEFEPRVKGQSSGGGVIDQNVGPNDPRTLWTWSSDELKASGAKADLPPRATTFHEFVVLLLHRDGEPEMVLLSIAAKNKHNTRAAERLTSFIKQQAMRGKQSAPIYGCVYSVESKSEKFAEGTAGVWVVNQVGRLDDPAQTDESWKRSAALFTLCKAMHESLAGKIINVEREPGGDDFDPAALEADVAVGTKTDM